MIRTVKNSLPFTPWQTSLFKHLWEVLSHFAITALWINTQRSTIVYGKVFTYTAEQTGPTRKETHKIQNSNKRVWILKVLSKNAEL